MFFNETNVPTASIWTPSSNLRVAEGGNGEFDGAGPQRNSELVLDWFHITMRLTARSQQVWLRAAIWAQVPEWLRVLQRLRAVGATQRLCRGAHHRRLSSSAFLALNSVPEHSGEGIHSVSADEPVALIGARQGKGKGFFLSRRSLNRRCRHRDRSPIRRGRFRAPQDSRARPSARRRLGRCNGCRRSV